MSRSKEKMFTYYTCATCSFILPDTQYSFGCPTCSIGDQLNVDIASCAKKIFSTDDIDPLFSTCSVHPKTCLLPLAPDSQEISHSYPNLQRKRKELSWISPRKITRPSRLIGQDTNTKGTCTKRLSIPNETARNPVTHTPLVVDTEERYMNDTNIDEGFYELSDTENETDTIWAQLEALMVGYGLPMAQITGESGRVRKSRIAGRWRRSADCMYEGKPMVRNQIRMRKATVRSAG